MKLKLDKCSVWISLLIALLSSEHASCLKYQTLDHLTPKTLLVKQAQTVQDLIQRLIGSRVSDFVVTVNLGIGPPNKDTFQLKNVGDKLSITGSSGVAAAWGFYYYLSQYCGCHVSWGGDQANIPSHLPLLPSHGVVITSNDRFRYYQNVCTVSYSFAWYNWTNWEREIDWMVMNGINLALAFNGQEAIWQRVYLKMGFTQAELDNFFGGPAFLAWSRMGNMHGWGGPLPQAWHDQQVALQHKILDRMRDFGMIPVLPAFNGDVPSTIKKHFPSVNVSQLSDWGDFNSTYCCTVLLDLKDPLFQSIGQQFLSEYIKEFGTNHIYNTDTFNEMNPSSSDPAYLSAAGKAVYNVLLAADSEAIWLMQGWLFLNDFWQPTQAKALLTSVPQGRMIVLDLSSEVYPQFKRLDSFYGQPFIWCMLHDYGGTMSMYGVLDVINKGPMEGRQFANSSMIGIGLTMEGINQNYVMYEFMLENGWRTEPRNVTQWIENYSRRRYGVNNSDTEYAWQKLKSSVYNCSDKERHHNQNAILRRPTTKLRFDVWYDPEDVFDAWDHFIKAAPELFNLKLFNYDLVDVTRQSLELISIAYYHQLLDCYKSKNMSAFMSTSDMFLSLLMDFDEVLATDDHFLLGHWLENAKALATNDDERRLYEYNARNQITLWGPSGNILDYAKKQWSGLVKAYYYPRWKLFINELLQHWNDSFDENQFKMDVFSQVEDPFTFDQSIFPTTPIGRPIDVATKIHKHYRQQTLMMTSFFNSFIKDISLKRKLKSSFLSSGSEYLSHSFENSI